MMQQNYAVPVYLFTGFLESGKTKFIQETLCDTRFDSGERTLLIVCEEGELEYEPEKFYSDDIAVRTVDDEEDFTEELLRQWEDETGCERVMVEWNGMWLPKGSRSMWVKRESRMVLTRVSEAVVLATRKVNWLTTWTAPTQTTARGSSWGVRPWMV